MIFKKISEKDLDKFAEYVQSTEYKLCEYSPFTIYMWREYYNIEYAEMQMEKHACGNGEDLDVLFLRYTIGEDRKSVYGWPLFKHSVDIETQLEAVEELLKYIETENIIEIETKKNFRIGNVPAEVIPFIEKKFHGAKVFTERDWSDYIYTFEDIQDLAGRKYSSKRNHIKNFDRNYPVSRFEAINEENHQQVLDFYNSLLERENQEMLLSGNMEASEELETKEMLEKLLDLKKSTEKFQIQGMVLYAGSQVAGFTIGAIVENTLMVHIEKADIHFKGVYTKLFHEYVLYNKDMGIKYINREDDVGEEGLRRSKLSYHPVALLDKYAVTITRDERA